MRALDKKRSGWIDINPLRSLLASAEGGGLSAEDADALVVTLGRALNLSGALHTAEVAPRSRSSSDGGGAASPARETDKNRACFVFLYLHHRHCLLCRSSFFLFYVLPLSFSPLFLSLFLQSATSPSKGPPQMPMPPMVSSPDHLLRKVTTRTVIDSERGKRLVKISAVVGNLARLIKAEAPGGFEVEEVAEEVATAAMPSESVPAAAEKITEEMAAMKEVVRG